MDKLVVKKRLLLIYKKVNEEIDTEQRHINLFKKYYYYMHSIKIKKFIQTSPAGDSFFKATLIKNISSLVSFCILSHLSCVIQ